MPIGTKYTPRPPSKFPLGERMEPVSQRELYMALTDFEGRRLVGMVTEPVLKATQSIRDALGSEQLQYSRLEQD